jgi:hypothetical protein
MDGIRIDADCHTHLVGLLSLGTTVRDQIPILPNTPICDSL